MGCVALLSPYTISYLGYEEKEVKYNGETTIRVDLIENAFKEPSYIDVWFPISDLDAINRLYRRQFTSG